MATSGTARAIIGGDRSKTTRPLRSDAIIGGDIRAIIGGDRSKTTRPLRSDAIIGGDIRAIIGGDRSKTTRPLRSDAIIGGDIRAIIGGDRGKTTRPLRSDAIIGGDIRAIIGGDRSKTTRPLRSDAIIGGDLTSNRRDLVVGLDPYAIFGRDAIVAGPIAKSGSTVSMLGRVFKVRPDQLELVANDVVNGQVAAVVHGSATSSGTIRAHRMVVTKEAYVDGVSQVLLTGKVSRVNPGSGSVQIGEVTVDYTNLLANGSLDLAVNDQIAVVGVRPSMLSAIQAIGLRLERPSK